MKIKKINKKIKGLNKWFTDTIGRLKTGNRRKFFQGFEKLGPTDPEVMEQIGLEMIKIIVRRTRLGFGVSKDAEPRKAFPPFKENAKGKTFPVKTTTKKGKEKVTRVGSAYLAWRYRNAPELDGTTRAPKRNLTLTGQLLRSMGIIRTGVNEVEIGPTGDRTGDKFTNLELATWLADGSYGGPPRPFNFLSNLEMRQLVRIWRKAYADLKGKFGGK